jgi:hypothetical protein
MMNLLKKRGGAFIYPGNPFANSVSIHAQIASRTLRYPPRISSSVPGVRCGSGNPWWIVFFADGTTGQTARALSQSVMARSIGTPLNVSSVFDWWPEMSMPISFMTAIARVLTRDWRVPAEKTSYLSPYVARR